MTQKKKKREKYAHQLILAEIESASKLNDGDIVSCVVSTGTVNRLLGFLEEMKISEKHFKEIAEELTRFLLYLNLKKDQMARIASLIAEFSQ